MTAAQASESHDSNTDQVAIGPLEFPLHEVLPDFIRGLRTPEELRVVGNLMLVTKIPKGHLDIMSAWAGVCANLGYEDPKVDDKLQAGIDATSASETKN